jgi:hypothetical protein
MAVANVDRFAWLSRNQKPTSMFGIHTCESVLTLSVPAMMPDIRICPDALQYHIHKCNQVIRALPPVTL